MTHTQARGAVVAAWTQIFGRAPTRAQAQAAQSIGWLESHYGAGWSGAGVGSHNWGAVQCCKPPCPPGTFLYEDSYPTAAGNVKYEVCFRAYPDDVAGAADMIRIAFKGTRALAEIGTGNIWNVSAAMYDAHYYGGFGPTREARISRHAEAMMGGITKAAAELGEPIEFVNLGGPGGRSRWGVVAAVVLGLGAGAGGVYYLRRRGVF